MDAESNAMKLRDWQRTGTDRKPEEDTDKRDTPTSSIEDGTVSIVLGKFDQTGLNDTSLVLSAAYKVTNSNDFN